MLEISLPFTYKYRIGFPNIEIFPTESDSQKRAYAIHKTNAVLKNGLPNGGKHSGESRLLGRAIYFIIRKELGFPILKTD